MTVLKGVERWCFHLDFWRPCIFVNNNQIYYRKGQEKMNLTCLKDKG